MPRTLGVATTTTLRRHVEALERSTEARPAATAGPDELRRYKAFYDGAASWSRVERIIARVEASPQGTDTRFVVTNLAGGTARTLYEGLYCRRGQAENHIKSWKTHLAADRTSCHRASANQLRLMLHTGAYWLMWSLRRLMPARSTWRVAHFDTLRPRLLKIAARVVACKTKLLVHLPSPCPDQTILRLALELCRAWSSDPRGDVARPSPSPQPQASQSATSKPTSPPATGRHACTTIPCRQKYPI